MWSSPPQVQLGPAVAGTARIGAKQMALACPHRREVGSRLASEDQGHNPSLLFLMNRNFCVKLT